MFPQDGQKLEEIFAGFDERMRTFHESRALGLEQCKADVERIRSPVHDEGQEPVQGQGGKRKGSYGKKGSSSFGCGWKRDVKGPETRQS